MKKGGPKNDLKKERSKMGSRGSLRSLTGRWVGPGPRRRIKDPREKQPKEERKREEGMRNEERGIKTCILNTPWAEGPANFP